MVKEPHVPLASEQLLGFVTNEDLQFTPGTRFKYDNSDNVVAALMSEAATGRSHSGLWDALVYEPVGLVQTSLPQSSLCRIHSCTAMTSQRTVHP